MKILKLACVSCLLVGAGLLSSLALESHRETLKNRDSLRKERISIIADPRGGESVYDWLYLHRVKIPTRHHYTSYGISSVMLILAVWLMLFEGKRTPNKTKVPLADSRIDQ